MPTVLIGERSELAYPRILFYNYFTEMTSREKGLSPLRREISDLPEFSPQFIVAIGHNSLKVTKMEILVRIRKRVPYQITTMTIISMFCDF